MAGSMAGSRDAGYLTSGQVARLLGVSKGTVLRAAVAGTLHTAHVMPGGALRFMPAEVERYVQWLRRTQQLQATLAATANLVPILREDVPDAADRDLPEPRATLPAGASVETVGPSPPLASGWDLLFSRIDSTPGDVAENATTLLALVAESLQVGGTCLARPDGGTWRIAQFHDRAGMGLQAGALLPYSPVYGQDLADGGMPSLIVEDLRADARFAGDTATADWHVGALTAIPLVWADGQVYGALCTLHPHARSVSSGEIPLLRLAGRMLVQAAQAAAALERERNAARRAAVFAAMVEYSDDAIVGMSLGGQIETWNTGATRLYGYTAAETIGQPIGLLVPTDRADELPALLARIARGERVDRFETVRTRKDGRRVDIAFTISPIRNGAGEILAASTIARDITALTRARAEQEQARVLAEELAQLRQEQAQEASALAAVGAAFAGTLDATALYRTVLEQAARLVPYDLAAVVLVEDDHYVVVASAGALRLEAGTAFARRPLPGLNGPDAAAAPRYVADTLLLPPGRTLPVEIATAGLRSIIDLPLIVEGMQVGFLGLGSLTPNRYTDRHLRLVGTLGERVDQALRNVRLFAAEQARARVAEELVQVRSAADAALRFQASLLDAVGQAMIATDLLGTITYWNRAAEVLYGWPAAEVLGRNVLDVTPTPQSVKESAAIIDTLRRGATWSGEFQVQRRDGSVFPAVVTDAPVFDADGRMTGVIGVSSDLSARKQAEDARAASEERFREFFAHAPIGLTLVDPQGRILDANTAMQRILGYDEDELCRLTPAQLAHPADFAANWMHAEEVLAGKRDSFTMAKRYIRKDGGIVWGQLDVCITRDQRGAPRSIIGMLLDVTERHAAEERLRDSEAQYRRLVELAQEGIWQIDAAFRTVYVNQKMADLLGYDTAEMLGRPVSDFLDEAGRVARAAQLAQSGHDAPIEVDWELLGKDGSAVWVHITASAFLDEHGGYAGGMAMVTDIRRRKAEEQALAEARAAAEEMARLRAEQVEEAEAMSAVSSALAETLEPSRLYALILEQVERLMHCDHTCVLLYEDGWATVVASRGVLVQPEGTRLFPVAAIDPVMAYGSNGQPALISDTAAIRWSDVPPLVGEFAIRSAILVPLVLDGIVVGTFNVDSFTLHSYGEQHLARAVALGQRVTQALRNVRLFQLEQERARHAEEVARLKDDFVASISHELRTPLTAILGYAEILEARWAQLDDVRRLDQLQKIVQAANRQQRVVEDLLLLSRLEGRALAPTPTRVVVVSLVRQARDEVRANYANQHIEFDEQCGIQVLADPGRALRVLVNLLDNAAKYSPVGCPITVTCAVEDGMGVVRVRDYGSGVPEPGRERLFTRFGRVAGSRTRAGRVGTGLGLFLSRQLVEEMSGDLNLEATGPEGSTFRLRLPAGVARGDDGLEDG